MEDSTVGFRLTLAAMSGLVLSLVAGCPPEQHPVPPPPPPPDYWGELPPGQKALVKLTDPKMFPDFGPGFDHRPNLIQAAMYSRSYLEKPSSRQYFPYLPEITHDVAMASIDAFIEVVRTATSGEEMDRMIKERFDIYQSRGYQAGEPSQSKPPWRFPDTGVVLFTGYYRPIFDARLQPDSVYRWPLYKKPPDLEQDPTTFHYHARGGGAYYTRGEIHRGVLAGKGLELCYLSDPFEAYIITIQGSAKLRLADGSFFEIGYAGDNGRDYVSIAQELIKRGEITREQLSLQGLIRYFKEHPEKLDEMVSVNPRYVFFQPLPGGPFGSLGVPVTDMRTIATDKQIFPRAGICFIDTELPHRDSDGQIRPYRYGGFAMDQDTGGAIRAAGRCDVYMGTGPAKGELAGRTFAEGKLYYIFLKPGVGGSTPPAGGGAGAAESGSETDYSPPAEEFAEPKRTAPTPDSATPRRRLMSRLPPG